MEYIVIVSAACRNSNNWRLKDKSLKLYEAPKVIAGPFLNLQL